MQNLVSDTMQLSPAERSWLNWYGKTGKIFMGWSCWLNRNRYPIMEQTFASIANTRTKILQQWAKRQWAQLESCRSQLQLQDENYDAILRKTWQTMSDCTELFVIDRHGKVVLSTYNRRVGAGHLDPRAVTAGSRADRPVHPRRRQRAGRR